MSRLSCWLRHRRLWTVIEPHRLPWLAERWCPVCSRPPFYNDPQLFFDASLGAA